MSKNRYKTEKKQTLFAVWDISEPSLDFLFLKDIIEDRKSKYSSTYKKVFSKDEVKIFFKEIHKEKYYKKATHNTYAYRILLEDDSILEWKNDDGELWWWNSILLVMKRENIVNSMIIITRYYGGIHLNNDRFKHLVNATKIIIDKISWY